MKKFFIWIVGFLFFCFFSFFFRIPKGTMGIITRFGNPIYNQKKKIQIFSPGLHFKIPWIDKVEQINSNIQLLNYKIFYNSKIIKKPIVLYVKIIWKVSNFHDYFLNFRNNKSYIKQFLRKIIEKKIFLFFQNILFQKSFLNLKSNSYFFVSPIFKNVDFLRSSNLFKNNLFFYENIYLLNFLYNKQFFPLNFKFLKNFGIKILGLNFSQIFLPPIIIHKINNIKCLKLEFIVKKNFFS